MPLHSNMHAKPHINARSVISMRAFTLIEVMVAVSVLAILIAVAVPSFTAQIQRNKMRSTTADLIVAVAHARNEAVTRAKTLYVHPKNTGWNSGWCVSTLSTSCGDSSQNLREFTGPRGISLQGSVNSSATTALAFNSLGHLDNSIASNRFSICASTSTQGTKIEILSLGQALTQDCTCANNLCN